MLHTLITALCLLPVAQSEPEPNVLLLIADDLGMDLVNAYGKHDHPAKTPRLDALAANGLRFDRAYSDPVCSPSRVGLMTGQYGSDHLLGNATGHLVGAPIWWDDQIDNPSIGGDYIAPQLPFIPERAPDHYKTGMVGKLHWDHRYEGDGSDPNQPNDNSAIDRGFDRYMGAPDGALAATETDPNGLGFTKYRHINVSDGTAPEVTDPDPDGNMLYITSREVNDALTLIDEFEGHPWFVTVAFHAPHRPFHIPPSNLHTETGLAQDLADVEQLPPFLSNGSIVNPAYAQAARPLIRAAAEALDTEIGRLLDSLDPIVRANTIVIFVSDNGTPRQTFDDYQAPSLQASKFGLRGAKGTVFEGGIRVPLIVWGRNVTSHPTPLKQIVNLQDIHATVLELIGGTPPPATPSFSLVPFFSDATLRPQRPAVYSRSHRLNGPLPICNNPASYLRVREMARNTRYKLIRRSGDLQGQPIEAFYDILNDELEATPLTPLMSGYSQVDYDELCSLLSLDGFQSCNAMTCP